MEPRVGWVRVTASPYPTTAHAFPSVGNSLNRRTVPEYDLDDFYHILSYVFSSLALLSHATVGEHTIFLRFGS